MQSPTDLALFAHLVRRPDELLDLAQAALLIAEADYPELDIPRHLGRLDTIAAEASRRMQQQPLHTSVETLLFLLFGELGFHGNESDYYDPRNSFLNEVLDRRSGIPITLALVVTEVARRAGLRAAGVSFPGHFLVRFEVGTAETPLLVDPFVGKLLTPHDLRSLYARATGEERDPDPRLLHPASKVQILVRMLNNLRGIYAGRGDRDRLRAVLEKIQVLAPSEEVGRQIDQLGGQTGSAPWSPKNQGSN